MAPDNPAEAAHVGDWDRYTLELLEEDFDFDPSFSLDAIDWDESKRAWSQARLGDPDAPAPLIDENIETLSTVITHGGDLPPGTVYRDDHGRWVILSGNHRAPAHRRVGAKSMPVYVVRSLEGLPLTDPRVQDVASKANAQHGEPVRLEHRIEQAARLVEAGDYTINHAAQFLNVPEGKLRDHVEKLRARRRLLDAGAATEKIPVTAQRRLASISSDRVLRAAAQLVPLMPKKSEEVNSLVVAINEARSEEDQMTLVHETEAALKAAGTTQARARGRKAGALVSHRMRRLDGAIAVITKFDVSELERNAIPPEFRRHLKDRVTTAIDTLMKVQERL